MGLLKFEAVDKTRIRIRFRKKDLFLDFSLVTEEGQSAFELVSIDAAKQSMRAEWKHPVFGIISESWEMGKKKNAVQGSFRWSVVPIADGHGMILRQIAFAPQMQPYFMIPSVLYGTNNLANSKSLQPQLNYRGDIFYPKSPVIRTRSDRSTHNAVVAVYDESVVSFRINETAYCGEAEHYTGIGVDTRNVDIYDRINLSLGFHHFPRLYRGKLGDKSVSEDQVYGYAQFRSRKALVGEGHFYFSSAHDVWAREKPIEYFYSKIHQHPGNIVDHKTAAVDIATALCADAYRKEDNYFPTVISGKMADTGTAGDTAWTGGMQAAWPLLTAGDLVLEAGPLAVSYMTNLVKTGINPRSGFFFESKDGNAWKISGWWTNLLTSYNADLKKLSSVHSAYVNGQAVCYLLKSYRYLAKRGKLSADAGLWLGACRSILEKVMNLQRYDGAFGAYFDPDNGAVVSWNGFQGAWFLAALSELLMIEDTVPRRKSFEMAEIHYRRYLERGELWGMPMDTGDATDEEGNLAYITALKSYHELTGKKEYLNILIHALHYEFSWKFPYNTRHENEPLKSLGWPSCGGSVTSTHNIHVHQMGNLIAEEMYYAYRHSGDEYILSRLRDTLNWGLGTYNRTDDWFGFGKKGWATEQFFHSDGVQDDPNRIPDGGIWPDYLCWAASCVLLSSAADIPDELYK